MKILIKDDTIGGETKNTFTLETSASFLLVRDLIRLRVYSEVEKFNKELPEYFTSLVQPTNAEVTLNGYRMNKKRKVDPEKQYYLALDAFSKNAFFLLINNVQVESLEQELEVKDNMEMQFIKLTPLVGG